MRLVFTPWRPFTARVDPAVKRAYLKTLGKNAKAAFLRGIAGKKSGRYYGRHRASAAGEYPAKPTGAHRGTVDYKVSNDRVVVGSGRFYAAFLRHGTSKMAPRKMSPDALGEALETTRIGRFARFQYV